MYFDFPNSVIKFDTELSILFRTLGCYTYHDACEYVWKLPYGRTSNGSDWTLVLTEKKGTCSTKHALLKVLADELGLNIRLVIGIYPMKESNTPGVGAILSKADIEHIPEAHCYLIYQHKRVDLTRFGYQSEESIDYFFYERDIEPTDIGDFKKQLHMSYISEHYSSQQAKELWAIREQCISVLSV